MIFGSRSHFRSGLLALALVAAGCGGGGGGGGGAGDAGPLVVATTTVLGDVVSGLVGDAATVEVLVPAGTDPHDFEPSARQAARLRHADLVVANGLGLEVGLASTLDSARADGVAVVEVGDLIDPLPFASRPDAPGSADDHDHAHDDVDDHAHDDVDDHAHDDVDDHDHAHDGNAAPGSADDHDHAHDHGGVDPHFWHDPNRMIEAVPGLVAALVEAVPSLDPDDLDDRAAALVAELHSVDAEVEQILDVVPADRRYLLTNHHTLGYFAHRYRFDVIGAVIPGGDTLASPSAAELAGLVQLIEAHRLPAIFAETVASTAIADTLAAEVGFPVEVVELYTDSLGGPGSDAATYVEMLRTNARRVAQALR